MFETEREKERKRQGGRERGKERDRDRDRDRDGGKSERASACFFSSECQNTILGISFSKSQHDGRLQEPCQTRFYRNYRTEKLTVGMKHWNYIVHQMNLKHRVRNQDKGKRNSLRVGYTQVGRPYYPNPVLHNVHASCLSAT
jgi:hypothetical protein